MRSDYILSEDVKHILAALTPPNRLACEISLATGLRISDVLALKADQLSSRFTVQEQKTGKRKAVYLNSGLLGRCLRCAGRIYVFPNRLDGKQHRTRQAVYKDIKRAAAMYRCRLNVTPHSLRKIYAVEHYASSGGNLNKVKHLLNHNSEAVTMIYALADQLTKRSKKIILN